MEEEMKIAHALSILFLLSLFAFNTQAEEYKAPKLKWKKNRVIPSPRAAEEKNFQDFGESNWRVQEDPYKERNLASEDEEEGRNPSSEKKDFKPIPRPWKYQPKK